MSRCKADGMKKKKEDGSRDRDRWSKIAVMSTS